METTEFYNDNIQEIGRYVNNFVIIQHFKYYICILFVHINI